VESVSCVLRGLRRCCCQRLYGPLLDAGCGTAVFTAASYRSTGRPLVLVDRSLGMLRRAAQRVSVDPSRVALIQADVFDLPFQPGSFATVTCHGLLHLFDDPAQVLGVLRRLLKPDERALAGRLEGDFDVGRETFGPADL